MLYLTLRKKSMKETKAQKFKKDLLATAEHYLNNKQNYQYHLLRRQAKKQIKPANIEYKALSYYLTNQFSLEHIIHSFKKQYHLEINEKRLKELYVDNINFIKRWSLKKFLKYYPFIFICTYKVYVKKLKNKTAPYYLALIFSISATGQFQVLHYQFLRQDEIKKYYETILNRLEIRGIEYIEILYLNLKSDYIDENQSLYKFHFSKTLHYFFNLNAKGNFESGLKRYYKLFQEVLLKANFEQAAFAFEDVINDLSLSNEEYDHLSFEFLRNLLIFYQLPLKTRQMLVLHNYINQFWKNWLKELNTNTNHKHVSLNVYKNLFNVYLQKMSHYYETFKIKDFNNIYNELKDTDLFDDFDE